MNSANHNLKDDEYFKSVGWVLWLVLIANLAVTIVKIALGITVGALAVIADGFHSLVDSSSNLVGLAAINLARRPADERHPYGYRRYETLGALAIGGLLLVAGWEILQAIFVRFTQGNQPEITPLALGIILLTFPVNLIVAVYEAKAGKRLNSEILLADAKHTQTDLYITGSVVFSMLGTYLGLGWLDIVVAAFVVILILRAAISILGETARWLTDVVVVDSELIEQIAYSAPAVRFVHRVRSRGTADAAFVDLHVKVNPGMSTSQAHAIASEIERLLISEIDHVIDALVHIEPAAQERPNQWENMSLDVRQIADGMNLGIHDLHIHTNVQGEYSVELHLELRNKITLGEAHDLADDFEARVQSRWPQTQTITTHLEPMPQDMLLPGELPDPAHQEKISRILKKYVSPAQILSVQVFRSGEHIHAAASISMDKNLLLEEAHEITEEIETDLLNQIPILSRVTLHLEPQP
ncbi:MAG: cation-efflux pump [Chloroflexota bacterium]